MNTLAKKTVLDTIRDTLEQNSQHAMAQAFSTRATGSQMHIEGDFGNGSQFKGTDLDDTVTITGNLVGNSPNKSTLIELLGGNDTVTVEGKIMASENGNLSITTGEYEATGDKTINANSGIENSGGNIDIYIASTGQNNLTIKGNLQAIGTTKLTAQNSIELSGDFYTGQNTLTITGNVIAVNEASNLYIDTTVSSSKVFVGGNM